MQRPSHSGVRAGPRAEIRFEYPRAGRENVLSISADTRDRIIAWEDRLERAEIRRTGLPAGMLLFTILAVLLFWNRYAGESTLRAGLTWVFSYGAGVVLLLALNEVTARRMIRRAEDEIRLLRDPNSERHLDGGRVAEE